MKTDNALIPFNSDEFGKVRAMLIDGQPWFVGKDVAKALGYKDHKNALKQHVDDEDKMGWRITTPSRGNQTVTLINESGVYALIFGSKLPKAKGFKRWVTADLLPTLRETGTYTLNRDQRWLETRLGTKKSHHPFTDAIKLLIEYLRRHGETREDGYIYGHLTNLIQNAVGVKRGQRDNAPVATLNKLDQVQSMVANLILQILSLRQDVKTLAQVEATIALQLQTFNRLLGGQMPLLNGR